MHVVLVPGLWLDGSSWDRVVPALERAGHHPQPLTLPGMGSADADRSDVTLRDCVDSVVAAIDAADGPVTVVGHSLGAAIAYAAVDARPDRVARAVLVGGFPGGDGSPIAEGFTAENGEIPMPDWTEFDDADVADLDDTLRGEFRARAVPSPGRLTIDPMRLTDDRRYDVPITMICPEYTSDMLRRWVAAGEAPVAEVPKIRDVEYVDLPAGHWPQFTRPDDLAREIVAAITRTKVTP